MLTILSRNRMKAMPGLLPLPAQPPIALPQYSQQPLASGVVVAPLPHSLHAMAPFAHRRAHLCGLFLADQLTDTKNIGPPMFYCAQ